MVGCRDGGVGGRRPGWIYIPPIGWGSASFTCIQNMD